MFYLIDNINNYTDYELKICKMKMKSEKIKSLNKITNKQYINQKIISENLLITGLKKFYNLEYIKENFYQNEYNKPFIVDKNIFYNISHSNQFCVCAFSNKKIGVDIEKIRLTDLRTINFFATEKEKKYILKDKKNIYQRLFQIYTLKEAYFKMKGQSLKEIKNVEFFIDSNNIKCNDDNINIKQIVVKNKYVISFCEQK